MLSCDLFRGIRGAHSQQRFRGPETSDQFRKKFCIARHHFRDLIRTAYRPSITSLQESEDVLSRHWEDLETL
jgi:hypothetical protein